MLQKFIGDKAFYRRVMTVAIPILIQNTITNFVSLLDNIMVGKVGTLEMSGVSIINQLMFVFMLCVFGAVAGAGIFTAQFYGCQDHKGIRQTFRFKILIGFAISALGIGIFYFFGNELISMYLQGDNDPAEAALTLQHGRSYLMVMLFGLLPFALSNAYCSTLRETGQTFVPMVAGICAVLVNLALNYVLIFGHLGAPAMGVRGAALATVISRYTELAIVAGWTHLNGAKNPFIRGAYRSLHIPAGLLKQITIKGMPLLINEFLFASGMAVMNQCYSVRGLDVVAAMNINSTIYNMGSVAFLTMGNVVAIIMGQMMGANNTKEEIQDSHRKLTVLSVGSCFLFGLILVAISGIFPMIYNTSDSVRGLATQLICISAAFMPFNAYIHSAYFALRSGGKTFVTFLFDSGFVWCLNVPLAYLLSRFTGVPIIPLYLTCLSTDILKCLVGYFMVRSGNWIQNLTKV
jgi:putative MATE family efflux protein